jgi:ABC-2 type transport system ATP-binding protein
MITLSHLQKVSDGQPVLGIDRLHVAAGAIAAIVGPPGSGLDPLLDLLIGRRRPTAGTVRLDDIDPADGGAFSERAGVLFSEDALYPRRSARRHLIFDARLRGLPKARVDEVLTIVGLADHAEMQAGKLSSGLRRRLAFGRAILHRPANLILRDPFARCDAASVELITRCIRDQAEEKTTTLILNHDTTHLLHLCDTIHRLEHGSIVESLEPTSDPATILPLKIPVKMEGEVALVNPADILYAGAHEGRSILHTVNGALATQFTLSELETRLARRGFFRAHRSYLVNLQHAKSVIPYTRNTYSLVIDDAEGTEIPMSRTSAAELRDLLGY